MSSSKIDRIVLGSADLRDVPDTQRVLDRFFDRGGRSLDLANVYADGESQRAIGRWLRSTGAEMTLYAKGCHPPYCSPSLVGREVDKARSDVGVEALDVFMLHRDDSSLPAAAFGEALLEQVQRGSVKGFGVSNWTLERFVELQNALGDDARNLVVFSNHFSLVEMVTPTWPGTLGMSTDDLVLIDGLGAIPIAWASLAAGYFVRRDSPSWDSDDNEQRRRRAERLAGERGTTATVVALAYVLNQPVRVLAAVGTRSEAHLEQLLAAATLELTPGDVDWLESG
jgi:aryl-alcohol dehydrogenase-like predicted oxidoreductase